MLPERVKKTFEINKEDSWIFFILAGLSIVVLFPFVETGFASGDDVEFMLTAESGYSLTTAKLYAETAGRFYFYVTKLFYDLPYLIGDLYFVKLINIIFIALNFILASIIVKKITNDKWLGYFTFLIALVFISIKGSNNPVTSFQWYFSFSFCFILLSILFAVQHAGNKKRKYKIYSFVCYTLGLVFYESYLIYLPLIIFILSLPSLRNNELGPNGKIKRAFYNTYPIIIIGAIYLLAYFLFRAYISPSIYAGTQFSADISLGTIFKTITNLAAGAYPGFYYFNGHGVYQEGSYLLENHQHDLIALLKNAKSVWYFKAIVMTVLSYVLINKSRFANKKKAFGLIMIAFLFIYLPHLPLSLTQKYSGGYFANSYVTTYFSFISITVLLGLLFVSVKHITVKKVQYVTKFFILVSIFLGSIMCDYSNWHTVNDLKNKLNTFKCVDEFTKTEFFKELPEESYIYSPNIYTPASHVSWAHMHNWSDYIRIKTGKRLTVSNNRASFIEKFKNKDKNCYYLQYSFYRKSKDRYIAIGLLNDKSIVDSTKNEFYSDSLAVFYYSTCKDFCLNFGINNRNDSTIKIRVNDTLLLTNKSYAKLRIKYKKYNEYFKPIYLTTDDIDLTSVSITNNLSENEVDVEL